MAPRLNPTRALELLPWAAVVPLFWLSGCENREQQAPLEEIGSIPEIDSKRAGSVTPNEFRRTDLRMKGAGELAVEAEIEEVVEGVRVSVEVDDAKPGTYQLAVYESGSCGQQPSEWGAPFQLAAENAQPLKIDVKKDGQGSARWLTARGNLRDSDPDSLLGKLLAFRASKAGSDSGEALACSIIELD